MKVSAFESRVLMTIVREWISLGSRLLGVSPLTHGQLCHKKQTNLIDLPKEV